MLGKNNIFFLSMFRNKEGLREMVVVVTLGLVLVLGWTAFDNHLYFSLFGLPAHAASSTGSSTLSVTIAPSITFSIDGTCDNDNTCDLNAAANFGTIAAGTPNDSNVRVKTVSNDTVTLAIGRQRSAPATTLASSADATNTNISDTAGGIDVFTGCGSPVSQPWNDAASSGLGFSVWAATENKDTTCWGTGVNDSHASNKYAALQASSSASTAWLSTSAGTKYASVGFTLDVIATQRATAYAGQVVFTGTTTP